jgi:CxxC motif-containing protein
MRILTTTVALTGDEPRRLPVRSSAEIPLEDIIPLIRNLSQKTLDPPLRCGDVLFRDLPVQGIHIIATDNAE